MKVKIKTLLLSKVIISLLKRFGSVKMGEGDDGESPIVLCTAC